MAANGRIYPVKKNGRSTGSWRVDWTENGKHRTRTLPNRALAQQVLSDVRNRTAAPELYTKPDAVLGVWIDDHWTPTHLRSLAPSTQGPLEAVVARVPQWLRLMTVRNITKADIRRALVEIAGAGYSKASLEKTRATLHGVFQLALDDARIARNPVAGVKIPTVATSNGGRRAAAGIGPDDVIATDDVLAIVDAMPEWAGDIAIVLAFAGLRMGEAAALQVRHWDPDTGQLKIEQAQSKAPARLAATGQAREIKAPKTQRSIRTIAVPTIVADALNRRTNGKGPDDWILTGAQGSMLHTGNWRKRHWHRARQDSGVDVVWTPHDLRHHCASALLQAGVNPAAVAAYLGHTVQVLMNTYAGYFTEDTDRVVDALNNAANPAR